MGLYQIKADRAHFCHPDIGEPDRKHSGWETALLSHPDELCFLCEIPELQVTSMETTAGTGFSSGKPLSSHDSPFSERTRSGFHFRKIRGSDPQTGRYPERMTDQCRLAFSAAQALLREKKSDFGDVVRVIYIVKDAARLAACAPFVSDAFGPHRPATTVLAVSSLGDPEAEIELELITHDPAVAELA